ncbi:putative phage related protein [Escherichia coli]|uniref:Putative phage related protein n=1 Tax=Escherichia coli TaxID=562 RepID=A0A377AWR2_ECOLX|nr:putative phage related protein [Escherichia coli]
MLPVLTRHKLYENDTGSEDGNGLPPHSVAVIVDGGDVTDIAQAIRGNKGQGTATHGTTSVTVPDKYGNPHVIKFSRSSDVPVYARIKLKVFTGYTSQIGQQIQQAISDYINSLTIGDSVLLSRILLTGESWRGEWRECTLLRYSGTDDWEIPGGFVVIKH